MQKLVYSGEARKPFLGQVRSKPVVGVRGRVRDLLAAQISLSKVAADICDMYGACDCIRCQGGTYDGIRTGYN